MPFTPPPSNTRSTGPPRRPFVPIPCSTIPPLSRPDGRGSHLRCRSGRHVAPAYQVARSSPPYHYAPVEARRIRSRPASLASVVTGSWDITAKCDESPIRRTRSRQNKIFSKIDKFIRNSLRIHPPISAACYPFPREGSARAKRAPVTVSEDKSDHWPIRGGRDRREQTLCRHPAGTKPRRINAHHTHL